jgi:hypothetical protein
MQSNFGEEKAMDKSLFHLITINLEQLEAFLALDEVENEVLEYKGALNDEVIETIAAMANTSGGLILLGVAAETRKDGERERSHPGKPVGVPRGDALRLTNKCHTLLDPPFVPEILPVPLRDSEKVVLILRVRPDKAPVRPIISRKDRVGKTYIRLGETTVEADPYRLRQLFAEPVSQGREDRPTVSLLPSNTGYGDRQDFSLVLRVGYRARGGTESTWTSGEREAISKALKNSPLCRWMEAQFQLADEQFSWQITSSQEHSISLSYNPKMPPMEAPISAKAFLDTSGTTYLDVVIGTKEVFHQFMRYPRPSSALAAAETRFDGSERLNWDEAYQLTLAGLATLANRRFLEMLPGPNWDRRLSIYLLADPGASLEQRISSSSSWKHTKGNQGRDDLLENIPWESNSLDALNEVARQFWKGHFYKMGFLGFEDDLGKQPPDTVLQELQKDYQSQWDSV